MQSTVGQKNTYGRGQRAVGRGDKLTRKTNTKAKATIKANFKKKKSFKVINYQATVGGYLLKGFEAAACDKRAADAAAADFTLPGCTLNRFQMPVKSHSPPVSHI